MTALMPGGNVAITVGSLQIDVHYSPLPGVDIDICAFALLDTGKVRGDADMCFYGQPSVHGGAIQVTAAAAGLGRFVLDLGRLDSSVERVALTATIHENQASFERVSSLALSLTGGVEAQISTRAMAETALILGELYRRQGLWKFRCVGQGFIGGLEPLARHFGVEVATPPSAAPAADPPPALPSASVSPSPSAISLSKVTLDKSRSSISLEKTAAGFGEIKVNLNWNQTLGGGGFFSRKKAIDLDVGCLYELQDGEKGAIQALGDSFGDLDSEPFIQLMGDDRTGSVVGGEWLHVNGQRWSEIRRILIYAFIYDGAPNWRATDGVVTLFIPGQPDIEVRLDEEGGNHGMCAIALLENVNGAVKVSRRVDFHQGHRKLDQAYGWGMRWSAGSK